MRKGYTVRTAWECSFGDTVIVVANYAFKNEVVCYPMVNWPLVIRSSADIGMWKVKQLKNQL